MTAVVGRQDDEYISWLTSGGAGKGGEIACVIGNQVKVI